MNIYAHELRRLHKQGKDLTEPYYLPLVQKAFPIALSRVRSISVDATSSCVWAFGLVGSESFLTWVSRSEDPRHSGFQKMAPGESLRINKQYFTVPKQTERSEAWRRITKAWAVLWGKDE